MKILKKIWRGATAGSPNRHVAAQITIAIGKRKVVKVPTFPEGRVHRVCIKQSDGTAVAFTARLVESTLPYGDETSDDAYNAATAANPEVFDVITAAAGAAQGATSGTVLDWKDSVGAPYVNQQGDTQTVRERFLYLVLIPTNAATETKWEVCVVLSENI